DDQSAAGDLLRLTAAADDAFRMVAEPALGRWKYAAAADMWTARLSDGLATQTAVRLACQGLAAVGHQAAVEPLTGLLLHSSAAFGKRQAAAATLAQLQPAVALTQARQLRSGSTRERLLAVALLSNADEDCLQELRTLCTDP